MKDNIVKDKSYKFSSILNYTETEETLNLCDELRKILTSIVKTSQGNNS